MKIILAILLSVTLFGCESLKFKNLAKTGATTAVTYAVAGGIPAISVLATSITVDEVLPEEPKIDQIETKEQSAAYIADSLFMNTLYGFIAFLLITNVLTPFLTRRWGYNLAKAKYKGDKNEN
jgi:archaellum biogenesis protein FlaJ (TadC family)